MDIDVFYILQSCNDGFYITTDGGYTSTIDNRNIQEFDTVEEAKEFSKYCLSEYETFNIIECKTTRKVIETIN